MKCFAYNKQGQRCDAAKAHTEHTFTVRWSDDECFDPTVDGPVMVDVPVIRPPMYQDVPTAAQGTESVPEPEGPVIGSDGEPLPLAQVLNDGPPPQDLATGVPLKCMACGHKWHGDEECEASIRVPQFKTRTECGCHTSVA